MGAIDVLTRLPIDELYLDTTFCDPRSVPPVCSGAVCSTDWRQIHVSAAA
jgi:hypothetical protein